MRLAKERNRLAQGVARADRIEFIGLAWPLVLSAFIGVWLFNLAFPDGAGNAPLLAGLGVIAAGIGVILWIAVRRVHDLGRSGWWLLALTIFGRILQLVAIGLGHDPASTQILFAAIFIALAYLSVVPGTPGTNRFGAERAPWVGPLVQTPALSLMTPAPGSADFEGDLLELAADAYDLKSVVHFADVMGGSQVIIDRDGQVFTAARRKRGWRVEYVVQTVEAPDFTDLKSRLLQSYPAWVEHRSQGSSIELAEADADPRLHALARAENAKDLVEAVFKDAG